MKKILAGLIASAFLILGLAGFYLDPGGTGKVEVLDCRNQSFTCSETLIEKRASSCESWYPWDPYSEFSCNYTQQNLDEVSFVTDPANYVDDPMGSQEFDVSVIEEPANGAWDLEFLPGNRLIWTEIPGEVYTMESGEKRKVADFDVPESYKAGVFGLAVDPDFRQNRFVYIYRTTSVSDKGNFPNKKAWNNRISRFRLADGDLTDEKVLKKVPGAGIHNGGRLEFGPDGKLYASVGDAFGYYRASNVSFLGGKILRMNTDGTVPEDNPYENLVYTLGHRNPQGLAWSPGSGDLYNSEHGSWRGDEVNRVDKGESYGWSGYICDRKAFYGRFNSTTGPDTDGYYENSEPFHCFRNWTMGPSGMTFVNDTESRWHGDLFVTGLRGKQVHRFIFEDGDYIRDEVFYVSDDEKEVSLRLRDIEYRERKLYVLGDEGGMAVLEPQAVDR